MLRLEIGGMVVGLFEHTMVDEQTLQLDTGDLLLAYSDGVTEARNPDGEEFGEERLLASVQANSDLAPSELLQSVFSAVHEFSAGATQADDLTLLVLRFAGCYVAGRMGCAEMIRRLAWSLSDMTSRNLAPFTASDYNQLMIQVSTPGVSTRWE